MAQILRRIKENVIDFKLLPLIVEKDIISAVNISLIIDRKKNGMSGRNINIDSKVLYESTVRKPLVDIVNS